MKKSALITGITGQDGAYLAQFLLDKGYTVFGAYRRTSSVNFWRLAFLGIESHPSLKLVEYDLTDSSSAVRLVQSCHPDEIYNLAAQSFVGVSFDQPMTTALISGLGTLNLLEAVRVVDKKIRFYQASTSEMYGLVQEIPQTESTPYYPRSPYAVAKLYAHWITINYRESFNMYAACGILFNHESPLRGIEFVTRKITDGVARIALGHEHVLQLGNLDAKRDWGYAAEYVDGIWRVLQHNEPDTFVLATNRTITVRDFVTTAFSVASIQIEWRGSGDTEIAYSPSLQRDVVRVNPEFYRPAEVDILVGDASKAKRLLGWQPTTSYEELCKLMVVADMSRVRANIRV
jgi:GDPmannose 4,6-dehydratase